MKFNNDFKLRLVQVSVVWFVYLVNAEFFTQACFDVKFYSKGKSTIALLLESFYNLDSGKITIDGYDIKDLDLKWVRGNLIGFINQVMLRLI